MGEDSSYYTKSFPAEALGRLETLTKKGVISDTILQSIFRNSQILSSEADLKTGISRHDSQASYCIWVFPT
jgi:hypothetical protein